MRYFFVVNPVAGLGKSFLVWRKIKEILKEKGVNFDYALTKYPKHATKLTMEAVRSGFKNIVAVGGDGTVSEVARGVEREDVVIGTIPAGRGKDFPKSLNIPKDPIKALDLILKGGKIVEVDHPKVDNDRFINACGVGFDAEVSRNANVTYKNFRALSYAISIFTTIVLWKLPEIVIKIDNVVREIPVFFVVIANGPFYGGGMKVSPYSKINDGLLDVVIFHKMSKFTLLWNYPGVYTGGKHVNHERVETLKAKRVEIESKENLYTHADGDIIGNVPKVFKIDGKKLKFIGG